jgi:hypothetical protein
MPEDTKVIWLSELTEGMVSHLEADDLEELIDALNDAVASVCSDFDVEG